MKVRNGIRFSTMASLLLFVAGIGCGLAGTLALGATAKPSDVSPTATAVSPALKPISDELDEVGDTVELAIVRNGEERTVPLRLPERPQV